jgi:hypothetical protein
VKRSSVLALGAGGLIGYGVVHVSASPCPKFGLPLTGKHIVILRAGFGGLSAASKLVELAGDQVRISLIDQHNYHLFTPMLYQVATCGVVPYDVAIPLRSFAGPRGIRFRRARVGTASVLPRSLDT